MRGVLIGRCEDQPILAAMAAFAVFVICGVCLPISAQQQGPIAPPPGMMPPPSQPQPKPAAGAMPQGGPMKPEQQSTSLGSPSIPIDQIIQKFAAKEGEFKTERENYTYKQTFVVQTLDDSDRVDGEFKRVSDIIFDANNKRTEVFTYAPTPTLERVTLTTEDFNDLEQLYPFVLTTEELPKYDIKYVDHVPLDELNTYIFDVAPKAMEKNQRYFQGRIWVDDKDFQIVKTYGQPVGYSKRKKGNDEQLFPHFETFRENIDGKYWFPTYSRANEVLPFKDNPVRLRVTVRYENYKRFGVTVKIGKPAKAPDEPEKK